MKIPKDDMIENVLMWLQNVPALSTDQVARMYEGVGSPEKRASELLFYMEEQGFLVGKRREAGKTKIWRLSKTGREALGMDTRPFQIKASNIEHILKIGDVWFELQFQLEGLEEFHFEWLEEYQSKNGIWRRYRANAFYCFQGEPYFLEVQNPDVSYQNWKKRLQLVDEFFTEHHYKKASFQKNHENPVKPKLVLVGKMEKGILKTEAQIFKGAG